MIKVNFTCELCDGTEGTLIAEHGTVSVECSNCNEWELMNDEVAI